MKLILLWFLSVFGVIFLAILCFVPFANGHEGHDFKHMVNPSGPIILVQHCPDALMLWTIDDDEDGVADRCKLLFFEHERLHVKEIPMTKGECICPQ